MKPASHSPASTIGCTGVSAGWCPRCGKCTCPDREQAMDYAACPLHGRSSQHAEESTEELDDVIAERDALRAEVATLTQERDEARAERRAARLDRDAAEERVAELQRLVRGAR